MKVNIFIKDALTGSVIRNEVETKENSFDEMSNFHDKYKNEYPNAHINFYWYPKGCDKPSFICGMPLNMQLDEKKLDEGGMEWEYYMQKWYTTPLNMQSLTNEVEC